jgi:DNA-binding MarR family transcriptional regulator
VKLGYVERVPHPTDRRTIFARLTPTGRKVVETSTPALASSKFGLDALTNKEAATVFELLRKVRIAAGDFDEIATASPPEE